MLKLISFSPYPREKKFSASLQKLFLSVSKAFSSFLTMPGNAMFAFKDPLVRFTLRQVGSFVQNYLFTRNPQYTNISAVGATLG